MVHELIHGYEFALTIVMVFEPMVILNFMFKLMLMPVLALMLEQAIE